MSCRGVYVISIIENPTSNCKPPFAMKRLIAVEMFLKNCTQCGS